MNNPADTNPNHLLVLDALHKHLWTDVKIWVFGSRADWTAKYSSDLDMALEDDSALDCGAIVAPETAFEESILPCKVDIMHINQASDSFRRMADAQKIQFSMEQYTNNIMSSQNQVAKLDNNLVVEIKSDPNLVNDKKTRIQNRCQLVNLGNCITINGESCLPKEARPFINHLDAKNIHENHINKIQRIRIENDTLPSRARRKVKLYDIVHLMVGLNQKHFGIMKKIKSILLSEIRYRLILGGKA